MSLDRKRDRNIRLGLASLKAGLPHVEAAKVRDILQAEAAKPMRAAREQRDLQHGGLFGDAKLQKELF